MIRGLAKAPLTLLLLSTFAFTPQLSSAAPQAATINEAKAALSKAKSKLNDANILYKRKLTTLEQERASLLEIAAEKDRISLADNSNLSSEEVETAELTEHLYKEKQAKVLRLEERADNARDKVLKAEQEVTNLQLELSKLQIQLEQTSNSRPVAKTAPPKKAAPKPKTSSVKKVNVAKLEKQKKQASPAKAKPVSKKAIATASDEPGKWPHLSAATSKDRRYAKAALKKLAKNGKGQTGPFDTVKVTAKSSFGSKKMRYLGDNIYSLSAKVKAGYQSFEVFDQQYWFDIPSSDNGVVYRVLYDLTSLSDPKLYLFNEALIK